MDDEQTNGDGGAVWLPQYNGRPPLTGHPIYITSWVKTDTVRCFLTVLTHD